MSDVLLTFFMIVTDRDIVIADYAVRSYGKLRGVPFQLIVYSNWISSALKQRYFPRWRELDFVKIIENEWQTDDMKPKGPGLQGPYELSPSIWDRELKKLETPYFATVDADFEILNPRFIPALLERFDANPNLVAISTDYNPRTPEYYDSYTDEVICLNERLPTWFCIYSRRALVCNVSHAYYEEIMPGRVRRNAWDCGGYFQKALREEHGFEVEALDRKYQSDFIHYGAFSKNRHIDENNVALYRRLQIMRKRGLFGRSDLVTRALGALLSKILFRKVDRSTYPSAAGE